MLESWRQHGVAEPYDGEVTNDPITCRWVLSWKRLEKDETYKYEKSPNLSDSKW